MPEYGVDQHGLIHRADTANSAACVRQYSMHVIRVKTQHADAIPPATCLWCVAQVKRSVYFDQYEDEI